MICIADFLPGRQNLAAQRVHTAIKPLCTPGRAGSAAPIRRGDGGGNNAVVFLGGGLYDLRGGGGGSLREGPA